MSEFKTRDSSRVFYCLEITKMSISRLIRFFSTFSVLPIEIPVVVEQIIEEYDIVDDISIIPLDIPASELKGVHYRFLQRMEPPQTGFDRKVLIGFSRHLTVPWQRVVCCKELIHIMDGTPFRTTTRAGVDRLVPRLLSRSSIAPMGVADLGAIKDIIATYQALAVLFPEEMREHFASQFRAKKITIEKIASLVSLPIEHAELMMSEEWPSLMGHLCSLDE